MWATAPPVDCISVTFLRYCLDIPPCRDALRQDSWHGVRNAPIIDRTPPGFLARDPKCPYNRSRTMALCYPGTPWPFATPGGLPGGPLVKPLLIICLPV